MLTTPPIARHVLRRAFGYPDFRPMQARVVSAVLGGHDVLAVLPTGGGKSICFQVPALCPRLSSAPRQGIAASGPQTTTYGRTPVIR